MRDKRKMTYLGTGALTAALVFGGLGVAYGQTAEGSGPPAFIEMMERGGGPLFDVIADLTGLEIDEVAERRMDGESLAAIAESEGVSTDAVKEAAVAEFESSLDERLASTEAMNGGHGGMMGAMSAGPESVLADMAGLEVSDVHEARADGRTLAEIAEAEGVDIGAVIDATLENAEEGLQTAVDDGRIEAEDVDEILESMRARLEEMVDSTEMPPFGGRGGRGGPGGHGSLGGPGAPSGDDS